MHDEATVGHQANCHLNCGTGAGFQRERNWVTLHNLLAASAGNCNVVTSFAYISGTGLFSIIGPSSVKLQQQTLTHTLNQ